MNSRQALENWNYHLDPRNNTPSSDWIVAAFNSFLLVRVVAPSDEVKEKAFRVPLEENEVPGYVNQTDQPVLLTEESVELFMDEDGECEVCYFAMPFEMQVCGTCNGKGSYVDPSIDCNGLTRDDFDNDPDFAESYFSGGYDVTCQECKGQNVVATLDRDSCTPLQRSILRDVEREQAEERSYLQQCAMERAMGC